MTTSQDVTARDGRTVRVHDTADDLAGPARLTVLWHHGSPQTGSILAPLLASALPRGIRLLSYGRPDYGGSTARPGRTVGSAADDVRDITDALGVDELAMMGASGGGPHALACAALLPDRVRAAVTIAGIAPFDAAGLDWYAGMADAAAVRAAASGGREARARFEETAEFEPASFNDGDYAALAGPWAALGADVGIASADGAAGTRRPRRRRRRFHQAVGLRRRRSARPDARRARR
ncbi:alpha/beta fold hydrolase [Labedella phragmitis]|uniref:alpha/beta fold hydrolase n=1 Tax=Labedella phragmitis TaxID=2498849 RepID=UPI001FB6E182|nr:alpha/beta fold hydrolase [Labedella phragmitis]